MNDLELHAWISFADVVKNLLRNSRTENYKELVGKLLKSLQDSQLEHTYSSSLRIRGLAL